MSKILLKPSSLSIIGPASNNSDICSITGSCIKPPDNLYSYEAESVDSVCIVSANANIGFKKNVYSVSVDSSGNISKKIIEPSKQVYCRYKAPNLYSSSSWTPFFNEMLVAENSLTIFDHGQIKIKVIRLGSEPCIFYPFGNEKPSFNLPSNIPLEIQEDLFEAGQTSVKIKTNGIVQVQEGIYTISFDEADVVNLASPMIITAEIEK